MMKCQGVRASILSSSLGSVQEYNSTIKAGFDLCEHYYNCEFLKCELNISHDSSYV